MRRLVSFALLFITTVAAGRLIGQDKPTITVTGAPDAPILLSDNKTLVSLGRTNAAGQLAYDTSLLSGKPKWMDLHIERCPKKSLNKVTMTLFPRPADGKPEEHACPPGCDCPCKKAAVLWGNSLTTSLDSSGILSPSKPLLYVLGGGTAAGIALAATAGGGESNNTNNQPPVTTATLADVLGIWNATGTVTGPNSCQGVNFVTPFTFGGTMQAMTGTLTHSIANRNQTINLTGMATQQGNTFHIVLNGNGTLIGLGAFNAAVTVDTNQKTATATYSITTNACSLGWSMTLNKS